MRAVKPLSNPGIEWMCPPSVIMAGEHAGSLVQIHAEGRFETCRYLHIPQLQISDLPLLSYFISTIGLVSENSPATSLQK